MSTVDSTAGIRFRAVLPVVVLLVSVAAGQRTSDREERRPAGQVINELGNQFRELGAWEQQAEEVDQVLEAIWRRNGWNSEWDRFSLELNREVARIPPWQFTRRLDAVTDKVGQRYGFNAYQRIRFQARLLTESLEMISTHGDVMLRQTRDWIGSRLSGKPVTAEDVQRLTIDSEALTRDMFRRINALAEDMGATLDPGQRAKLEQDLKSFRRQWRFVEQQREAWARGDWKPEDWGIDQVPEGRRGGDGGEGAAMGRAPGALPSALANRSASALAKNRARGRVVLRTATYQPENEDSWARFVREFIARYRLNGGQREAIHSILAEMQERAGRYRRIYAERLARVHPNDRAKSPLFDPLRDMFGELVERSRALLTDTQRATDNDDTSAENERPANQPQEAPRADDKPADKQQDR